jgi:multiple antibiotic resistance protein
MLTVIFTTFAGLFSVVNPIGAMPVFLALTEDEDPKAKRKIVLKSGLALFSILTISYLFGNYIMSFFGISIPAMRIAGGLIILNSGFALLKGEFAKNRAIDKKIKKEAKLKDDISITPLAIPMLAGPGSISYLIALSSNAGITFNGHLSVVIVILLTGIATVLTLLVSPFALKFLGQAGFKSLSRILGFIVMSIGIQYILTGITTSGLFM